ncbi:Brp/Blh family beta-carotene 15,15'-dioxygenase [Sediminibacterium sp.]|uniref:Brp/Blh family beta-carotene 15,15'-dioxygenase n=1 Tax=Sediminibacterium sp. TaxID=1917865 RepID=UPI003F71827A
MANNIQQIQFNRSLFIILVCLTGIISILHHFLFTIPENIQWIFFSIIIIITGIPHGALDHEVAKQTSNLNNQVFSAKKFHVKYLSSMLVYGVVWFVFPTLSFYLFLLISAFHFGETDLPIDSPKASFMGVLLQVSYGLLILFIILFLHIDTVLPIIQKINVLSPSLISYLSSEHIAVLAISGTFLFFLATLMLIFSIDKQLIDKIKSKLLLIIFVFISALILPLPLCFIIYFGLWHSITSLENIRQHLSYTKTELISWKSLMIKCIPLTAISLVGLFSLILFLDLDKNINLVIMGLFIGISILTLPHQEVMSKMYFLVRRKSSN